ncbi:PilZ domain-containing protein [Thermodesulfobacteriota bacterium]
MNNIKSEFLKTTEYPRFGTEASQLLFEKRKVVGAPVKVMRTGKELPDEGWHIVEVYSETDKNNVKQTLVKVCKPNKENLKKGLKKIVPLKILERTNPEIKFLLFESDKDYVLYEDKDHKFRIGLVIDIDFEKENLLVMLGPEGDDITASLDRIKITDAIDKSDDPRKLESIFQDEAKKRRDTSSDLDVKPKERRADERKNLVYYLKVTVTKEKQPLGHVVDITICGFMLATNKPIEPTSLFELQLFLPKEIHESRYFEFSAMSRWCQKDENPNNYNVGFQFLNVSMEGSQLIKQLIEKYSY